MLGDAALLGGRREICWADSGTVSFRCGLAGASLMAVGQAPHVLHANSPLHSYRRYAFLLETFAGGIICTFLRKDVSVSDVSALDSFSCKILTYKHGVKL